MYISTKLFKGYTFAHRQWQHNGDCKYIHGYSRNFEFEFAANKCDENGFVVDFGKLSPIKDMLTEFFDHTFLTRSDDPLLSVFQSLEISQALKLRVLDDVSCEGLAEFLCSRLCRWIRFPYDTENEFIKSLSGRKVTVVQVTVYENENNSATWINPRWKDDLNEVGVW